MISYETFKQIELKIAKVVNAERVEGSEKLIRLEVDLGSSLDLAQDISDSPLLTRQIVAGIGLKYSPEDLIGKNIVIVANLESRKLMGLESQGMLLAASNENEGPVLLTTMEEISPGSEVR